jgi:hypothetical protein
MFFTPSLFLSRKFLFWCGIYRVKNTVRFFSDRRFATGQSTEDWTSENPES